MDESKLRKKLIERFDEEWSKLPWLVRIGLNKSWGFSFFIMGASYEAENTSRIVKQISKEVFDKTTSERGDLRVIKTK